jgi:hypothetical protein
LLNLSVGARGDLACIHGQNESKKVKKPFDQVKININIRRELSDFYLWDRQ